MTNRQLIRNSKCFQSCPINDRNNYLNTRTEFRNKVVEIIKLIFGLFATRNTYHLHPFSLLVFSRWIRETNRSSGEIMEKEIALSATDLESWGKLIRYLKTVEINALFI